MSVLMSHTRPNRAADVGRGLAALVGVAVLVVGVPVALLAWVGSPLPAGVPTFSEIASALRDTYIPDEFLVKLLALVCWLVWIELVASLLVEAVAYARGRKAGSVPLAGGLQRSAARLVATVALLGAVLATKGMPEPATRGAQPLAPVSQPVMALVVDESGVDHASEATARADAAAPAAAPTYEVQRRDTLWDIAERHLGDPFRWQEIFQLNQGCPQADGGCLTDPDLIYAGWQLALPADAVGLEAAPAPAPAAGPTKRSPAPVGDSPVVDGGMVLIDDGSGGAGADVLLVDEPTSAGDTTGFDGPGTDGPGTDGPGSAGPGTGGPGLGGMVLIDDGTGVDEAAVLAGPPGSRGDDRGGDELASAPEALGPHARPGPHD